MSIAKSFCFIVLISMIGVTTAASLESNVVDGFRYLFQDQWGVATLMDAYFGFLFFYLWVFYRERSAVLRLVWLVAILSFGTIAMSIYLLLAFRSLPNGSKIEDLFKRKTA